MCTNLKTILTTSIQNCENRINSDQNQLQQIYQKKPEDGSIWDSIKNIFKGKSSDEKEIENLKTDIKSNQEILNTLLSEYNSMSCYMTEQDSDPGKNNCACSTTAQDSHKTNKHCACAAKAKNSHQTNNYGECKDPDSDLLNDSENTGQDSALDLLLNDSEETGQNSALDLLLNDDGTGKNLDTKNGYSGKPFYFFCTKGSNFNLS